MQPFLGIPLPPCLSLWHHPRYKQHSYFQGHSLQGFFFFFFSSVLGGTGLVLFRFLPKVSLPPREKDFEYGRKLPILTYGMVECVCMCVHTCVCVRTCVRARVCSVVSDSFATPWTVARQAPLSMGFSRQEYWNGLPFPSPGESSRPRD